MKGGGITAEALFGNADRLFRENHTVNRKPGLFGQKEHAGRQVQFLERTGERENDQVRTVEIALVVGDDEIRTAITLLAASCAGKIGVEDIADPGAPCSWHHKIPVSYHFHLL